MAGSLCQRRVWRQIEGVCEEMGQRGSLPLLVKEWCQRGRESGGHGLSGQSCVVNVMKSTLCNL